VEDKVGMRREAEEGKGRRRAERERRASSV